MNTKTIEFIEKAIKIHGDRYEYDSVDYINNYTKVIIFCRIHESFTQRPNNHLNGSNCPKCASTITTEEFIIKANKVHKERYSYLNADYKGVAEKIEITCSIHGNFTQKAQNHLRGINCPKCGNENRMNKLVSTKEQFIDKAKEIHGDKYDYSKVEYKGSNDKVKIFCSTHGMFLQRAKGHLIGNGCIKCGKETMADKRTKTKDEFIHEANLIHNGRYSYNQSEYIRGIEKIDILCKIHGLFKQSPNNHIKGQGCPKCTRSARESHWGRTKYIEKASGRTCIFYTLRCFNENEEFYKIGITMNTIKMRYGDSCKMPYDYEVMSEVKGSAGFIWDLELAEKRKLKALNYQPEITFKGSLTECFTQTHL
jgi:Zn finger protein HypA/HybF involved in hydrogenase expression